MKKRKNFLYCDSSPYSGIIAWREDIDEVISTSSQPANNINSTHFWHNVKSILKANVKNWQVYYEILLQRYEEELDYDEIANIHKISSDEVKVIEKHALQILKNNWKGAPY